MGTGPPGAPPEFADANGNTYDSEIIIHNMFVGGRCRF
jgi:hypothetical protein